MPTAAHSIDGQARTGERAAQPELPAHLAELHDKLAALSSQVYRESPTDRCIAEAMGVLAFETTALAGAFEP